MEVVCEIVAAVAAWASACARRGEEGVGSCGGGRESRAHARVSRGWLERPVGELARDFNGGYARRTRGDEDGGDEGGGVHLVARRGGGPRGRG